MRQLDQQPVPRLKGRIEFKDVFFQYTEQQTVLAGFNLTIKAGETVAFVGHTGAGKSSLGKLVARFYEFQGGQILIDGHDIRSFDLHSYHRQLGMVPQVPFLFSGTVADNIRYARPEASDEEVATVAGQIGRGDWLEAPVRLVEDGPLDYLILDYLAEVTMSILQKQRQQNPQLGYAQDFPPLIARIAATPQGLRDAVAGLSQEQFGASRSHRAVSRRH